MKYSITLNPNYQGSDPFSVLVCGDKYLLTVNGRNVCWVPSFQEAERLLNDPDSWVRRLLLV